MKKLFTLMMITIFAIALTACGGNDDPDPDPDPIVDCEETPDDPSCEIDCDPGYEEVDGNCVLIDDRTPEEIAADLIEDNWDGSMDHVDHMMEEMDFENAMTLITEFNIDVSDGEGNPHVVNVTVKDEVLQGEYDVIQRTVTGVAEEEEFEFIVILEETSTGVIVYYDTSFLRAIIDEEGATEVQEVLDTLDANGQWFMFKFDDSLANLVEFEVLKEMVVLALYQELGDDIFDQIEQAINDELGLNLVTYGFDFSDFVQLLIDEDFAAAELMLENVNYDQLILDLDQLHLVPQIVDHLTMYEADMLLVDPTWVLADEVAYLQANGTEAWLNQLTDQEIVNILTVHDPMLGEAYQAYLDDDLDHWLVMQWLNDPDVQMSLAEIPGLDVVAFTATMDGLDYDAWYLEDIDFEALFQAVYDGYEAYDVYVGNLNATSPQWASILMHFGGMEGTVDYLQQYMVYVDDIELGIQNLEMFEDYIDPQYYLDVDLLNITLAQTSEFHILSTATVQMDATSQVFQDFTQDLYDYLDAFESFDMPYVDVLNCPDLATCEVWAEYPEIIDVLEQLGDIVITVEYDPFNQDEVIIKIQYEDYVNNLLNIVDDMNESVVNDFSITITMMTEADPVVPEEDITDVNEKAEEFARFSLIMEAREYLEAIKEYYMMYPEEIPMVNTPVMTIEPYIGVSVAFDQELSYFRVTGNEVDGYDYELQLFWLDGTAVFTEALVHSEVDAQFGQDTGVPTRAEFVEWMEKVDPENFNMTKLFLVYMWERYREYPSPPVF